MRRPALGHAFAGLPPNVTVVPGQIEQAVETVAGDVGAIGCVQADARLDRVRAFVKIQDGCSFSCAFCVIPLVRGATRSRSADAVLGEIRRRVAQGHREIVLTGVNLGCFRDRAAGHTLPSLIRAAGAIDGVERLRLSSIEVNHVDDELVAALRETPVVGPPPARAAAVGRRRRAPRDGSPLLRRDVPAQARAAGRLQSDRRRDRRLPRGGRARLRADARDRARRPADEGARLPVLAPARDTHGRRGHGAARGEEGAERAAARALRGGLSRPVGVEDRARGRRPRRPARPRLRRRLLALARRRRARGARLRHAAAPSPEEGILADVAADDCLFCTLFHQGYPVAKTDGFVAIRDINPQAETHLLVIPERHVDTFRDISEFPADEAKRMLDFVAEVARGAGLEDYRVLVNVGPGGGQTVFHLHWHILGGKIRGMPA